MTLKREREREREREGGGERFTFVVFVLVKVCADDYVNENEFYLRVATC